MPFFPIVVRQMRFNLKLGAELGASSPDELGMAVREEMGSGQKSPTISA